MDSILVRTYTLFLFYGVHVTMFYTAISIYSFIWLASSVLFLCLNKLQIEGPLWFFLPCHIYIVTGLGYVTFFITIVSITIAVYKKDKRKVDILLICILLNIASILINYFESWGGK